VMRARHRTSKLLLRHGIVYYGGGTWTQAHHRWLQHQRFPLTSTQTAFDTSYETVVAGWGRARGGRSCWPRRRGGRWSGSTAPAHRGRRCCARGCPTSVGTRI
jgi:hypothetical protein